MARPSYLRQIAASRRSAAGTVTLAPPRVLFRPSPAPLELTLIEQRAASPQIRRPVAALPNPPLAAAAPMTALLPTLPNAPARATPTSMPRALPRSPEIAATTATAAMRDSPPVAMRAPMRPQAQRPSSARESEAPHAAASPPGKLASRAATMPQSEALRAEPIALRHPAAVPALPFRRASPTHEQPAPRQIPITPPVMSRPAARAPMPTSPTIVPLKPPLPPPRGGPIAERSAAAVCIGTLEVRVVAPPTISAPVAPQPVPVTPSAAPAPRRTDTPTARLARTFGAFGLSQA